MQVSAAIRAHARRPAAAQVARGAILAMACAVMAWRAPLLLRQPRIWAEEGTVYLAYAFANPAWKALVAPHQGYYHLYANLATLVALLAPMRQAALVTTLLAFAAQALPLAVVLWGRSRLWPSLPRQLLAVTVILLTPSSGECWLNTINSQFYLALTAALLLVEEPPRSAARRWIHRAILGLAVLSGPVTAFLAPLFVARALARRDEPEASTQAWLVVAGAMLQAGIALAALETPDAGPMRFAGITPASLLAVIWNRVVMVPLTSMRGGRAMAGLLLGLRDAGRAAPLGWALLAALAGLGLFLCRKRPPEQRYLALGALLLALLSTISALAGPGETKWALIHPGTAIRYYYAPSTLLMLALSARITWQRRAWRRLGSLLAAVALALSLALGAMDYRALMEPFVSADWPVWAEQVAIWETRPGHRLLIWPPPWEMTLVRWD